MNSRPLPSFEAFLERGMRRMNTDLDLCEICYRTCPVASPSTSNTASQIITSNNTANADVQDDDAPTSQPTQLVRCGHIFCRPCLMEEFTVAGYRNFCPKCRAVLFLEPEFSPVPQPLAWPEERMQSESEIREAEVRERERAAWFERELDREGESLRRELQHLMIRDTDSSLDRPEQPFYSEYPSVGQNTGEPRRPGTSTAQNTNATDGSSRNPYPGYIRTEGRGTSNTTSYTPYTSRGGRPRTSINPPSDRGRSAGHGITPYRSTPNYSRPLPTANSSRLAARVTSTRASAGSRLSSITRPASLQGWANRTLREHRVPTASTNYSEQSDLASMGRTDHQGLRRKLSTPDSSVPSVHSPRGRREHRSSGRGDIATSSSESCTPRQGSQTGLAVFASTQHVLQNASNASTPSINEDLLDGAGTVLILSSTAGNTSMTSLVHTTAYRPPGTQSQYTNWAQETFGTAPIGSSRDNRRNLSHTRSFLGALPRSRGNSSSPMGNFNRSLDEDVQTVLDRRRRLVVQLERDERIAAARRRAAEAANRVLEGRSLARRRQQR